MTKTEAESPIYASLGLNQSIKWIFFKYNFWFCYFQHIKLANRPAI